MNVFRKQKLINFLHDPESKMLIVWLLTILSYIIILSITKNPIVMLFSYFFLYFIYSKLYNYICNKITISFKENITTKNSSDMRGQRLENRRFSSLEGDSPLVNKANTV